MFCHKCGTQLPEDSGFCHKCGTKIVRDDTALQTSDMTSSTIEPKTVNIVEPSPETSVAPVQESVHNHVTDTDFKAFVDNHVRSTTRFQSADDLLKKSKPWRFLWFCFGIPAVIFFRAGVNLELLLLVVFLGYVAAFIVSGIIRMLYRGKFCGVFIGDINIEKLISFLNVHLQQIYPYFYEWGYLTEAGLLPVLENAIANASEEIRICSEFGPNRKRLVTISIKPKPIDAKQGEKLYYCGAVKNGFLMDGRAGGFIGHGTMIRTAPILQATIEYYIKNHNTEGADNNVL